VYAHLSPYPALVNKALACRDISLEHSEVSPREALVDVSAPPGWHVTQTETGCRVTAPPDLAPGRYTLGARIDGEAVQTVHRIAYDHVAPTACCVPAVVQVLACDVSLPEARIGYIGGGNDRVDTWLAAMGLRVRTLSDAELFSEVALAEVDAIVIGIFAMRFRRSVVQAMPSLHRWIHRGGTMVTLYHRPWDNWDPETVPPARLEIGQPSLRWRVTDETASVTHLAQHPILSTPNRIGPADWEGWHKERGLYFAKQWDTAYTPLLSMADPGQAPLTGALLVADLGKGRHIHTSLLLHHQMERLVPGAFRLMANFVSPRA